MTTDQPAISVKNLSRQFGNFLAVDGISFEVAAGEVFGLLGPNGAGKTTTLSILTTLLRPSAGEVFVAGHDVGRDPHQVRESIGIVFQEASVDERLTARENMEFHAVLYGMSRRLRAERIPQALTLVGLADRSDSLVEQFSGGMRRRLEIARGLLHVPAVLFLDEPTIGLDPQSRRSIWDHISRLRDTGVTIVMTTHYMEEAEFCDRIAIMDGGTIVALDSPAALKDRVGGDIVTVTTTEPESLLRFLMERDVHATRTESEVYIEVEYGARFLPALIRDFPEDIEQASLRRPTLDDVFLKLTGRTIRENAPRKPPLRSRTLRSPVARRGRK